MIWGDESEGRSDEFDAHKLDAAEYLDMQSSGTMGVSATAPEAEFADESAGLIEVEASGGGSAWRRRVAPRLRGAVKSFFPAAETKEDR